MRGITKDVVHEYASYLASPDTMPEELQSVGDSWFEWCDRNITDFDTLIGTFLNVQAVELRQLIKMCSVMIPDCGQLDYPDLQPGDASPPLADFPQLSELDEDAAFSTVESLKSCVAVLEDSQLKLGRRWCCGQVVVVVRDLGYVGIGIHGSGYWCTLCVLLSESFHNYNL